MSQIRIHLFGDCDVATTTGLRLRFKTAKAKALFAYLALENGEPVSRSKLAALLWSDRQDKQARRSLRHALSSLRSTLDSIGLSPLRVTDRGIALDPKVTETDVAVFVSLASSNDVHSLQSAADLYQGAFFDGFETGSPAFDEWISQENRAYQDIAVQVLSRLFEESLSNGSYASAVRTGCRLLQLDPYREDIHRALMKLHAANGQSAKALLHFKDLRAVLLRELGVAPEPETVSLLEQIEGSRKSGSTESAGAGPEISCRPLARKTPDDLPRSGLSPSISSRRVHATALGSVFGALLLAIWAYGIVPGPTAGTDAEGPVAVVSTPDAGPTVAVLPFDDLTVSAVQTFSAEVISEDLITDLSGLPGLKVVARSSSFRYGQDADIREIGRDLNARYILDGSLSEVDGAYRVSAQLIDARTGHHVWAGRYDRSRQDMMQSRDRLNATIVEALVLHIEVNEAGIGHAGQQTNVLAHQAYLAGRDRFSERTPGRLAIAIENFKLALEIDPDFAQAEAALADAYLFSYLENWSNLAGLPRGEEAYEMAVLHANNALLTDNPPALAHTVLAKAMYFLHARSESDYQDAIAEAQKAIYVDPDASDAFLGLGQILVRGGEPARAIAQLELARHLNPANAGFVEFNLALAYFNLERFEQAAKHVEQSVELAPEGYLNWTLALVTYIELGNEKLAKHAFDQAIKLRRQQGKGLLHSSQPPGVGTFLRYADEARLKRSMRAACRKFAPGYDI